MIQRYVHLLANSENWEPLERVISMQTCSLPRKDLYILRIITAREQLQVVVVVENIALGTVVTHRIFQNTENSPKSFRRCLVARPGKIFLMVDQMQAEDWPTSALANNMEALDDLKNGVDRHRKLGCLIFDIPWDYYTDKEWKDSIERYLGKKTRHANNYGMRANTMSDSLAKEGILLPRSSVK